MAAVAAVALSGCRIVIEVPEGGSVTSNNGVLCNAGESCEIDIIDATFYDVFSAVAASGYEFEGWEKGNGYLCGGSTDQCTLNAAGLSGASALFASDLIVYLRPKFRDPSQLYDQQEWASFLGGLGASNYRSNSYLYRDIPNVDQCDPGRMTSSAKNRFLYSLNMVRRLHNLPEVVYGNQYDVEMQQTNLVQEANDYFTHYPSPGDTCYTLDGDNGAGSSNLSWTSWQSDPARAPLSWVNDNNNVSSLMAAGHRRWVLYPYLSISAYGQVAGYSSMKVFGFDSSPAVDLADELEYIAVPYQTYPYVLVSKGSRPTPWSLTMVPASGSGSYNHFSNASVSVVETSSGNSLSVHSQYYDNRGYGMRNFLSWMVDGWEYDTEYTVTVESVNTPTNPSRTIEYRVEIDREELL
ncbi:MAG: hypothetical protein AAGA91_04740 [Pseudomonadota bacterium]